MSWTKGRKQRILEDVFDTLERSGISYEENIIFDALTKLNERELENMRDLVVDLSRKEE